MDPRKACCLQGCPSINFKVRNAALRVKDTIRVERVYVRLSDICPDARRLRRKAYLTMRMAILRIRKPLDQRVSGELYKRAGFPLDRLSSGNNKPDEISMAVSSVRRIAVDTVAPKDRVLRLQQGVVQRLLRLTRASTRTHRYLSTGRSTPSSGYPCTGASIWKQ